MSKRTKSYSREFKLEAVRLSYESDRTVAEVADELGISKSSLFRWRNELADDPEQAFPGRGQMKARDAEMARLRKELREAQLENEILKKQRCGTPPSSRAKGAEISVHPRPSPAISHPADVSGTAGFP